MEATTSISALAEALANAQAEITNPHKNREVVVRPREGSPYTFAYATLDGILDGVRPILAKNGLSIVQTMVLLGENRTPAMRTTLLHKSGESLATDVPMTIDKQSNQALGSAMSYARRYGILGILCLAADEDDDGNSADGNTLESRKERDPPVRHSPGGPTSPPPRQAAVPPPSHLPATGEAAAAKVEFERLTASLNAKLGTEEATHQIAAIRKRNGDRWKVTLAEVSALDSSTPKARD